MTIESEIEGLRKQIKTLTDEIRILRGQVAAQPYARPYIYPWNPYIYPRYPWVSTSSSSTGGCITWKDNGDGSTYGL